MRLEIHPAIAACMTVRRVGHGWMLQTKCGPPRTKYAPYGPCVTSPASPMFDDLSGDACEDFPSAARPSPERRTEHTRSAGLAASAYHRHQWIRGLTGGPGGAGRSTRFSPCPPLGR